MLPHSPLSLSVLIAMLAILSWLAPASAQERTDLGNSGSYLVSESLSPPANAAELPRWVSHQQKISRPSLFGGSYWLYSEFVVREPSQQWIFDASNTLIEHVDAYIYAPDGKLQNLHTGYRAAHEFMLHYGKHVETPQAGTYQVLVHFDSPYFRSYPKFELWPQHEYSGHVLTRNVIAIGCLGALVSLAIFNLFLYLIVRDHARLFYAAYMLTYAVGWAFVFNVPTGLFGPIGLHWNYVPFFLLPVFNTLFYLRFLNLPERFPTLARWSYINLVLPLILLPSCFIAQPYAHALATLVISIWLAIALVCGVASLRSGFTPARYFILAFLALLVPATLILPANLGLMPDLVDNELFTLVGGTLDGIILAFALADNIRIMVKQKDEYLSQLNQALALANTDGLTGVCNRYAFDEALRSSFHYEQPQSAEEPLMVLIDLDGLKLVNDRYGHTVGDDLLRHFAQRLLSRIQNVGEIYRLGGDEFAVLSCRAQAGFLETTLEEIETDLVKTVSPDAGISYGIAYSSEAATAAILVTLADTRMYLAKTSRQRRRLHLA